MGEGSCSFRVWAPRAERLEVRLVAPAEKLVPLQKGQAGYFHGVVAGVAPGARYFFRLDGAKDRPDPASRLQPEGVHGPSEVPAAGFAWEDQGWRGLELRDYVIYELHVGTFTPEGTFAAIIPHLEELAELGITALELMPVAQFPGTRNWGYDGVYPFAAQNSYGGPAGLQRLVEACHRQGLAVILDVVYNHLGPEGNYLWDYGFYFTDRYRTPWGDAVNFDGPHSDEVRRFFLENALYWLNDCHIDSLRLDGLHAIMDRSPRTFLEELAGAAHAQVERSGRRAYLLAESDLNEVRLLRAPELGGYGLDAHWNEDFHHALHTLLTGEQDGYYQDYGELGQLAKGFREGFIYSGQYSAFRQRRHGSSSRGLPGRRFIVFAQNHDQVGNRLLGERLTQMLSFEALKLAAGAIILSPFIPLLFMGEEYGEVAPFQYFISFSDPELVDAVRRGRREEFVGFGWRGDPPDPLSEETLQRSRLNHGLRQTPPHRTLWDFYRELLAIRRAYAGWGGPDEVDREVHLYEKDRTIMVRGPGREAETALLLNFGEKPASLSFVWLGGRWEKVLDSAEARWGGPGSPAPAALPPGGEISLTLGPQSVVLFARREGD